MRLCRCFCTQLIRVFFFTIISSHLVLSAWRHSQTVPQIIETAVYFLLFYKRCRCCILSTYSLMQFGGIYLRLCCDSSVLFSSTILSLCVFVSRLTARDCKWALNQVLAGLWWLPCLPVNFQVPSRENWQPDLD